MDDGPTSRLDPDRNWIDKSFFEKILKMRNEELWKLVYGRQSPSSREAQHLYDRTIKEIEFVGREISSLQRVIISKPMEEYISDFLHNLTRGLCMFEERYFPLEWMLPKKCCVQHAYSKGSRIGKHTMILKTRLFHVPIVCQISETSLIGKFIPKTLVEDSGTSVFHNAHRFYRNFLESAVEVLFGYKIEWVIEGRGKLSEEIEWFKKENPSSEIDFDHMRLNKENGHLNEDSKEIERKNNEVVEHLKEKEAKKMLKKCEEKLVISSTISQNVIDPYAAATPVSIEKELQTATSVFDRNTTLEYVQSHGETLKEFDLKSVLELVHSKKQRTIGSSSNIASNSKTAPFETSRTSSVFVSPTENKSPPSQRKTARRNIDFNMLTSPIITSQLPQKVNRPGSEYFEGNFKSSTNHSNENWNFPEVGNLKPRKYCERHISTKMTDTIKEYSCQTNGDEIYASHSLGINSYANGSTDIQPIDAFLLTRLLPGEQIEVSPSSVVSSECGSEASLQNDCYFDSPFALKTRRSYEENNIVDVQHHTGNLGVLHNSTHSARREPVSRFIPKPSFSMKPFSFKSNTKRVSQVASVFANSFEEEEEDNKDS